MSKLEKTSFRTALYFITAFFLLSELWDMLIYLLLPNSSRELTNLAAAIIHPGDIGGILLVALSSIIFIIAFSLALAWLLRKLGADEAFFNRQKLWLWVLAGAILSLMEFREVIGRFWVNALIFLLLGGLGYVYTMVQELEHQETRATN